MAFINECGAKRKAYIDVNFSTGQRGGRQILTKCVRAVDDEEKAGEVVPGIGGIIYDRIGLGGIKNKNSYIPNIVKRRRLAKK